ncbi:MAG: DUF423 domain-containing protein [Rhodothermales bacterium]|nr:DUF423 domain-containing protein [Rhodothermales bacterium]MBO6779179.1 DUF423 domain-containing protein [Rhodothermales bacterium]
MQDTEKVPVWLKWGVVLVGTGVAIGAFGAHALDGVVTEARLDTFETAVQYQTVHAMALIFGSLLAMGFPEERWLEWAMRLLLAGILVFSGSLYLLVLLDQGWLGAVTPFGGVILIAGYAAFLVAAFRMRRPPQRGA